MPLPWSHLAFFVVTTFELSNLCCSSCALWCFGAVLQKGDARIKGLDPSAPLSVCTAQFCSRASFERRSIKHAAPSQAGGGYSSSILAIYNHSKGSATSEHPAGAGEQVPAAWLARAAALCRCVCSHATRWPEQPSGHRVAWEVPGRGWSARKASLSGV